MIEKADKRTSDNCVERRTEKKNNYHEPLQMITHQEEHHGAESGKYGTAVSFPAAWQLASRRKLPVLVNVGFENALRQLLVPLYCYYTRAHLQRGVP